MTCFSSTNSVVGLSLVVEPGSLKSSKLELELDLRSLESLYVVSDVVPIATDQHVY